MCLIMLAQEVMNNMHARYILGMLNMEGELMDCWDLVFTRRFLQTTTSTLCSLTANFRQQVYIASRDSIETDLVSGSANNGHTSVIIYSNLMRR